MPRFEEGAEKPDVLGDVGDAVGLEIALRHVLEMRVDFLAVFGGELLAHRVAQFFALDGALAVEGLAIGQIKRGAAVELPDERLLPVGPVFVARALAVGQREQHQRIEIRPGF